MMHPRLALSTGGRQEVIMRIIALVAALSAIRPACAPPTTPSRSPLLPTGFVHSIVREALG
jgi:hypothetical protein